MKPEFMRLRRPIALALTSALALGGVIAFAPMGAAATYQDPLVASEESAAPASYPSPTPDAPNPPIVDISAEACVYGSAGPRATITVELSGLSIGWDYSVALWSEGATVATEELTAFAETATVAFPNQSPGSYHAAVTAAGESAVESAPVMVSDCNPAPTPGPSTTPTPPETIPDATTPPSQSPGPSPSPAPSTSPSVSPSPSPSPSTLPDSTTPPGPTTPPRGVLSESEVRSLITPSTCSTSRNLSNGTVAIALAGLDSTRTYYVRLVDSSGATAAGGAERSISGVTARSITFTGVPSPGTYSAVLSVGPAKQLVSSEQVVLSRACLSTLAITGPGGVLALVLLAALLMGLGTIAITGRLRRRVDL
jgi:hypothetical protein